MKSQQNIVFSFRKKEERQPLNNLMSSLEIRTKFIEKLEHYLVRVV